MTKEISVSSGTVHLIITNTPIKQALQLMPKSAELVEIRSNYVFSVMEFQSTHAALPYIEKMIENDGWVWAC